MPNVHTEAPTVSDNPIRARPLDASDPRITRVVDLNGRTTHVRDTAGNWQSVEQIPAQRQAAEATARAQQEANRQAAMRNAVNALGVAAVPTIGGDGGIEPKQPRGPAAPAKPDTDAELRAAFKHFDIDY